MCDATFGRAGEWGGGGQWPALAPQTVQPAQSINPILPNPIQSDSSHLNLLTTEPPPSCPSSFGVVLPLVSPRITSSHRCCRPGSQVGLPTQHCDPRAACRRAHVASHLRLPLLLPPLLHICRRTKSPKRATSSAMSSPSPISPTLTFTMLTYLSKHLYPPCLPPLSGHVGRLWSDQLLLPGSVEGLH